MIIKFGADCMPVVFLTTGTSSLLASPFVVGGVSVVVLGMGIVFGFLLARRKIKKGIEIYEDI